MGFDVAAMMGFLGIGGALTLVATIFAAWMAWRIVEKAGLPGWTGLGAILLTLTGIGTVVPLILLWIFAFMRWPRDAVATAVPTPQPSTMPPLPPRPLAAPRGWRLVGGGVTLVIDGPLNTWLLTSAPSDKPGELSVPDPSVGRPHARLLAAGERLGLEDLGTPGGTFIDGARLLPEHGPRDISAARVIRVGSVSLALSKAGAAE